MIRRYSAPWFFIFVLTIIIVASCKNHNRFSKNPKIHLQIVRFDKILFATDIYAPDDSIKKIARNYPAFMPLFSNKIIDIGDTSAPWFCNALKTFITDQAIYNIQKRVSEVFPDFNKETNELNTGFSNFNNLFPQFEIPTIYTYISGFNQSMVTAKGILGVSLEKYLGANDPLYNEVYPPIPKYQRKRMNPENIAPDALKAWISTEFEYTPEQKNMLSRMLYEGRNMYLLHKIFPGLPDSTLWNYSSAQMKFLRDNEKQMWSYLIEQKLLFITDNFRINQFIDEAPFTKDFSQNSPGRAAVWIGYRIIDKFMKHTNISLDGLMKENNYQKILNDSRYNP